MNIEIEGDKSCPFEQNSHQTAKKPTAKYIKAKYENIDKIGNGTYGQVYKVRCLQTNKIFAIKKILFHVKCS